MYPIVPTTQKLQDKAVDIIKTFDEVSVCIADLEHLRETIEDEFATA